MRPLIVSATEQEIANSIPFLQKNDIPYLITGVGMVATTYALTKYLAEHSCDYLINVGIAGAIDKELSIGHVVEIEKDIFSELGAQNNHDFIAIDELGFGKSEFIKITSEKLSTDLPKYTGITVNTIHGEENSISNLKIRYPNASIESMEGAAFFYVAKQLNLPSIQVRAISNYVEKRNKSTWNIPLSIKNLNHWLITHLQKIIN